MDASTLRRTALIPQNPPRHSTFRVRAQALLAILLIACLQTQTGHAADTDPALVSQPTWGTITSATNGTGVVLLEVRSWPADGKLALPTPFPHITSARLNKDQAARPLNWVFNADATALHIELPIDAPDKGPVTVRLEIAENTTQFADGRITFSALDSKVSGAQAKLETHPGNHRIGFWSDAMDSVSWQYKPTRWGMYDVDLTFSADGGGGTELAFEVAGKTLKTTRPSTGSWYRYTTLGVGRVYLEKSELFTLRAACLALKGAAVMNLKAVTLRPAPEGDSIVQSGDRSVTLLARDARTHSVLMRYEPAAIKNCLGYWANVKDWADWDFQVTHAGTFELEVWQGCGKGQGGSDVAIEIGGQRVDFTVEETGHFQSFLPRSLGRIFLPFPGAYSLAVKPQRKQAGAVMDIRQIRLIPVAASAAPKPGLAGALIAARRVVFLGDSITYAGEWVEFVEAYLRLQYPLATLDFVGLGLPSETLSGLSEPGHAGGSFPRPNVHERLGRILEKARPDIVVACYGMNDGIYHPFSEDRFQKFKDGVIRLRERAAAAGAQVIHVTPPTFDAVPIKARTLPAGLPEYRSPYEGYNEVLDRYSDWLVAQSALGWDVVDAHGPMNRFLADRRRDNPNFQLAGDGVHANTQGHWIIAREFLKALGASPEIVSSDSPEGLVKSFARADEVLKLVQQRQRSLKDSWLTAIAHTRPGMSKGKPLSEALREAALLATQIQSRVDLQFPGRRSRWFGFERFDFQVGGKPVLVVAPKQAAPGRPWVWHGEFFGHKPNPDLALLGRGFHVVYLSVPDMLGSPEAVQSWNNLFRELTQVYGFSKKPALVGLSRGGLYVYNWAAANPNNVACIYGDAPVCDFKSWPGGFGKGARSERDWKLVLERYGFKDDSDAKSYGKNPVDNLQPLIAAKVPLLHVYGDADEVVPWQENTGLLAKRYKELGGSITLIAKPGVKHHPHGLDDSTPIVKFIWENTANPEAKQRLSQHGGGPLDAFNRPLLRKQGSIDVDLVETTPIVLGGKLWRFEWVRHGAGQPYYGNTRGTNYFRFRDPASGDVTEPFADGHEFGSAFVQGDTVYVTGTLGRGQVNVFASRDLKAWETWTAIPAGRFGIFNTSICKAENDFVLMFEIDKPAEEAGKAFTARFTRSKDLRTWTLTDPECQYSKDRYTAPHCLRWLDGWFYDFYLENHNGYEMRVVRSRDLIQWQPSPLNPVLAASQEDKLIANPKLNDAQRSRIANAVNLNNSDIDFCEFQGRMIIHYSWGNQQGIEHIAEAHYDGNEAQFLRGWYPDPER